MENKENLNSWLFGLEKFFQFRGETKKYELVRALIHLRYYKIDDRPWALKKILAFDAKHFPDVDRDTRWNVYTDMYVKEEISAKLVFWLMSSIWPNDKLINDLHLFFNNTEHVVANDLFSKSQVLSKIWMAESLRKFVSKPVDILLIGGWYGQHRWYLKDIPVKSITNIDLDNQATFVSKTIADTENETYNVITGDINFLLQDGGTVNIDNVDRQFDIVINTSSEHMDDSWFNKLAENQTVLIQNNNMFDIDDHINCVPNLETMHKKYQIRHINTMGQMALNNGNRYMIFGVK